MKPIKVLLIDDNDDNRTLIKLALEITTNWEVMVAENGIEGIIAAELEQPDVILLDLIMPDIDGLSVYEILKQNLFTYTTPVIFVTAMVNHRVLSQLKKSGADGIITKPLNTATLGSDIAKICDWQFSKRKKNRLKNWDEKYCSVDNRSFCMLKIDPEDSFNYLIV